MDIDGISIFKIFKDSMIKLHGTICLDNIPVSVVGLSGHSCPGSLTKET